ncbi:glucosyl transferase [Synechococcus sp. RSCCF101]|uniref:glycosyltransferase n=1 Tax=Synechococcus sp. RSCCF101 TaxID=2511069 RepID=UPI00124607A4|nr:glycosyltransferase [Synechococcus sp. RSCCF101]QEY31479.1 glucosyl transferase [Synechococcus sp. RSCCF101]
MILVAAGNDPYPFDRLMEWVGLIIQRQLFGSEVVIQIGRCGVIPEGARIYRDVDSYHFDRLLEEAELVISHCGEDVLGLLEQRSMPFVLVPRAARYGEQVDDHQVELGRALQELGVPVAWSPTDLLRFLSEPRRSALEDLPSRSSAFLCRSLEQYAGRIER